MNILTSAFKLAILALFLLIAARVANPSDRPDSNAAPDRHLAAIQSRDLDAFASTLTKVTRYT